MLDTQTVTQYVLDAVSQVPEIGPQGAALMNPDVSARFPCCVVQPPLQSPRYQGAVWNLSFTVEVWAGEALESMRLFDLVKAELSGLNLELTGNLPLQQDVFTEKWRFGGYFEVRWNADTNYFMKS